LLSLNIGFEAIIFFVEHRTRFLTFLYDFSTLLLKKRQKLINEKVKVN